MNKVLIISYYFPPSGGPGVQRVLKTVKYLHEFGWQPVVLTVEDGDFPARDESLLNEIPPGVAVHRTKIFEPYGLYRKLTRKPGNAAVDVENIPRHGGTRSAAERIAGFIRETLFIPDARVAWLATAVPAAMRIIRDEGIDAIYTSSPPYTTALIGLSLKRQTRLPWIAGFRDPWTGFLSTPERWAVPRSIDRNMEARVFRAADLIDCAWQGIVDDFRQKFPDGNIHKLIHLPNGFDPADYPPPSGPPNVRFTVTYTGSMYGRRNPATFLRAVEQLVAEHTVDASKIRLQFIGRFGADVREMLDRSSLGAVVERVDYLPHLESVRRLQRSDLLLLVVDESKDSREIVPGKVFEYLGARKPILALCEPDSAAARLLSETKAGRIAPNTDVEAIKSAFVECYRNFLYHTPCSQPDDAAIRRYERRTVTGRLAELLDHLRERRPSPTP